MRVIFESKKEKKVSLKDLNRGSIFRFDGDSNFYLWGFDAGHTYHIISNGCFFTNIQSGSVTYYSSYKYTEKLQEKVTVYDAVVTITERD